MQNVITHPPSENKFRLAEPSYADALRVIGYDVSKYQPDFLEIERKGNQFQVNGRVADLGESPHGNVFRRLKTLVAGLFAKKPDTTSDDTSSGTFAFVYEAEDIDKRRRALTLNREWRVKLVKEARSTTIFSLAGMLRTIGADLDDDGVRLLKLTKDKHSLVAQLQDREGNSLSRHYSPLLLHNKHQEMLSDRRNRGLGDPWLDAK